MSSYDSLSLAGLDARLVLQLDHPSCSSHLYTLTTPSCCTSFRTPSRVKAPMLNNVTPLSNCTTYSKARPSFELLPPVPTVSSFQLSLILGTTAQPFPHPPQPLHYSKSSADLSRQAVESHHMSTHESYHAPEVDDTNNPYTPWPRSIRPSVPPSSFATMSHLSHYSRPLSRSGAMAPEPFASNISVHRLGCRIPGLHKMKRTMRIFSRRLHSFKAILRRRNRTRTSISPVNLRPTSALSIALSVTSRSSFNRSSRSRSSAMSLTRDSLASWIEGRNRAIIEQATSPSSGHESMDIDEYERRGSWLFDLEGDCGIDECPIHHVRSAKHVEVGEGKYVGLSLAAGEEAFRRRRTNSSPRSQSRVS